MRGAILIGIIGTTIVAVAIQYITGADCLERELILWENVDLADDPTRLEAFRTLEEPVRYLLPPPDPRRASGGPVGIARAGILPEHTIEKLRAAAEVARDRADGDLSVVRTIPLAEARRLLRRFPSISEPGADKVLRFTHTYPVLALESNGLRALTRLGYGRETKSYTAMHRSVLAAVVGALPEDFETLIRTHLPLRRHGQELCRRSAPLCEACPLASDCSYWLTWVRTG